VLVTKLDRLARSTHDLQNILKAIQTADADLKVLDTPSLDTTNPYGKLLFDILGALAEFERSLIKKVVSPYLTLHSDISDNVHYQRHPLSLPPIADKEKPASKGGYQVVRFKRSSHPWAMLLKISETDTSLAGSTRLGDCRGP
jgi:hypothetical protein